MGFFAMPTADLIPSTQAVSETFCVLARCRAFSSAVTRRDLAVGISIEQALCVIGVRRVNGLGFAVYLNDRAVRPERYEQTYPKRGDRVTINVVPMGGGGGGGGDKQGGGRLLAALAILALTIALSGGALALIAAYAFVGYAASKFKIVPPPPPKLDSMSGTSGEGGPSYYISGSKNSARQYGVVGRNLGRNLVVPSYGAQPYSELVGDDQYIRFLFVVSEGAQSLEHIKINETKISNYKGVEMEINPGLSGDKTHKLFPKTANVQDMGIVLKEKNGSVTRTSGSDADEINLELTFSRGLIELTPEGNSKKRKVELVIEWRPTGSSGDWKRVPNTVFEAKTREVLRKSVSWTPRDRDQYDIRLRRVTADASTEVRTGKPTLLDEVTLTKIQTFTNEPPVVMDSLCSIALRIKATDQLNGDLGTFNCVAYSLFEMTELSFNLHFKDYTIAKTDSRKFLPNNREARTIEAWFKTNNAGEGDQGGLWTAGISGQRRGEDFSFRIKTSVATDNWRLDFFESKIDVVLTDSMDGEWHHVAVVYDPAGTDSVRIVYDGAEVYNAAAPTIDTDLTRFIVGAWRQGKDDGKDSRDWHFDGRIRDVRVWTVARSTGAIAADMESVLTGDEAGLICWLPCSEGRGGILYDLSNNGNHAYLGGGYEWETSNRPPVTQLRFSQNPSLHVQEVLCGTANLDPCDPSELDTASLAAFKAYCDERDLSFNMVVDFGSSVIEMLGMICAAGQGSFAETDSGYGVVIDRADTVVKQHFTPRNSRGFKCTKLFNDPAHASVVRFVNEEKDYTQDERIIYADGYSKDGAGDTDEATTFDRLELAGVTDPDQIYKLARYHIAVAQQRPRVVDIETDIEFIQCQRGALVRLTHDVPLIGSGTARITGIHRNADDEITGFSVDSEITMEEGMSYIAHVRSIDKANAVINCVDILLETEAGSQRAFLLEMDANDEPVALTDEIYEGDLVSFGEWVDDASSGYTEFVVHEIVPTEDLQARLTLLDKSPAIYDAADGEIPAFDSNITVPPVVQFASAVPRITAAVSDESALRFEPDGSVVVQVLLRFAFDAGGRDVVEQIQARWALSSLPDQPWTMAPAQPYQAGNAITLVGPQQGLNYNIELRSIGRRGSVSQWSTAYGHFVVGQSTPPPVPTDLLVSIEKAGAKSISWVDAEFLPRDYYGVQIRFGRGSDVDWADMYPLHKSTLVAGPLITTAIPLGDVTIGIKSVDLSGNLSTTAYTENFTFAGDDSATFFITEDMRAQSWPGHDGGSTFLTDGQLNADGALEVLTGGAWDDMATWDSWSTWANGAASPLMIYTSPVIDLGRVQRFRADVFQSGYGRMMLSIDLSDDNITWGSTLIGATLSPSIVGNGLYTGRYVRFIASAASSGGFSGDHNLLRLEYLSYSLSNAPVEQEFLAVDTSIGALGTGDFRLPITKPFLAIDTVTINFVGDGPNWTYEVVDYDVDDGPRIKIYESGALSHSTVNALVRGM